MIIYFNFKSPLPNPSGFDIAIHFLDVIRREGSDLLLKPLHVFSLTPQG